MRRLAALLLVAGCHSGLSPEQYPAELARAICAPQSQCRNEAAWREAGCERETIDGFVPDLGKAIAAKRVQFNETAANECLAGYASRGCERQSTETDIACEKALTGLVAQGGQCDWRFECAGTNCESQKNGACPGTCGAAIPKGGTCGVDSVQCDRTLGLRCIANVCSEVHAAGADCGSDSDCKPELYCDGSAGKCVVRANEGVLCVEDAACAPGLFCRMTDAGGLCEKQALRGAPCGQDVAHADSAPSQCGFGRVCAGFKAQKGAPIAGTCMAAGQLGAACTADADINGCATGLVCSGGRCAMATVGASCAAKADNCAEGQYCDPTAQTCMLAKGIGEPCSAQYECKSRFCEGATGKCAEPDDPACHEP